MERTPFIAILLCSVTTPLVTCRRLADHSRWNASYSECSSSCGNGVQELEEIWCVSSLGQRVQEQQCDNMPRPAPQKQCISDELCEWRAVGSQSCDCAVEDVQCVHKDSTEPVDKALCLSAKNLLSEEEFRKRSRSQPCGCANESLHTICVTTMNAPLPVPPRSSSKALQEANEQARHLAAACGSDVIVFAVQELTGRFRSGFSSFAKEIPGYTVVGRCGGHLSADVVVVARTDLRRLFGASAGRCFFDDTSEDNSFTNKKGSSVLEVFTRMGSLVVASTHGDRGGTYNAGRVAGLRATANLITSLRPSMVAWGGDFNQRLSNAQEALEQGTTHPEFTDSENIDQVPQWSSSYDPKLAHTILTRQKDIFGDPGNYSFAEEVGKASNNALAEVKGVRRLCPTYKKKPGLGQFKPDHSLPIENSGFKLFGKRMGVEYVKTWRPRFACQAPGSDVVEFYPSPLDGKTKWEGSSSRAPSWTERLVVNAEMAPSCSQPKKIVSDEDHDSIYTVCTMPPLMANTAEQ